MTGPKNPYGGGPGTGLTLPPYFKPTKYVKNAKNFFPGLEELGPDEMRVSFIGSTPWPPHRDQAGTAIMVELGNGDRFFFDFGPGCIRNILALQVPAMLINDIFLTHLHFDHYGDVPYLLPFTASGGRYTPLRVTGPSGASPELGTRAMLDSMKEMLRWHLEAFDYGPIGDGYEIEVNEFDHTDDGGVCYEKNGVTVRHWRRSHVKDGASAFRLDWHEPGLSFVWTGDGRPDELTVEYSKGVDVFVTEALLDAARLIKVKYGWPPWFFNYMMDTHHTPHYAVGYLMKQIQPRIGMVTHLQFERDLLNEITAGVRYHWDGLFAFGAPDLVVVNVTKDAIWVRDAVIPQVSGTAKPTAAQRYGTTDLPSSVQVPQPRMPREAQQDPYLREIEIDPKKYYPPDVYRDPVTKLPDPIEVDPRKFWVSDD